MLVLWVLKLIHVEHILGCETSPFPKGTTPLHDSRTKHNCTFLPMELWTCARAKTPKPLEPSLLGQGMRTCLNPMASIPQTEHCGFRRPLPRLVMFDLQHKHLFWLNPKMKWRRWWQKKGKHTPTSFWSLWSFLPFFNGASATSAGLAGVPGILSVFSDEIDGRLMPVLWKLRPIILLL